jgi:curli biogenesis system outer membrane secretion channel CsgG
MWTKRNYLTCVGLMLCLLQALPVHGQGVQPATNCPLNLGTSLTEQHLGDLLNVVADARILAIAEACGVELTDDQLSSLRRVFPEQGSILDQIARLREPEPGGLATVPVSAQGAKPRVAIMNFENNSRWSRWGNNLGAAAAAELTAQIVQSGQFTVIERAQLEVILSEQDFGASGRVDAATASKIGQLLGVQLVFTGSISQFSIERRSIGFRGIGGSFSNAETALEVRLINADSGEILMTAEGQGNKRMAGGYFRGASASAEQTFDERAAQEALRPAVENVVAAVARRAGEFASLQPPMPVSQIVGEREGAFYINRGQNAGVTVGQQFAVSRVIDEIRDANGQVLDRVVDQVGRVEVTQVLSQSAIVKVTEGEAAVNDTVQ